MPNDIKKCTPISASEDKKILLSIYRVTFYTFFPEKDIQFNGVNYMVVGVV
jgi:hypothetical protein